MQESNLKQVFGTPKCMKIDFMNRRVSQPGDRKKEERKENLHNILMLQFTAEH